MSVKSSVTVFRVLRHLAAAGRPLSAAEVAATLSVPVSTAARALATLEAAGYAERHLGSPRFVIGTSARTLAFAFMAQFPVRDLAMPYLQQLTLEAGLTSSIFVRLGWFAVRIARILGPSILIHDLTLGESLPLTAGAAPFAILASLPESDFDRALTVLNRTGESRTLRRSCEAVRAEGIAIQTSLGEMIAFDVAMPLINSQGNVIAAVALEAAPAELLPTIKNPDGPARRVMQELAAKIHGERTIELAHYDHIDPDGITF